MVGRSHQLAGSPCCMFMVPRGVTTSNINIRSTWNSLKQWEKKNKEFLSCSHFQMDKGRVQLVSVISLMLDCPKNCFICLCSLVRRNKSWVILLYLTCVFSHSRGGSVLRLLMTLQRIAGSTDILVSQPVSELTWAGTLIINWVSLSKDGNFLSNLSPWNALFLALSIWASGNEMEEQMDLILSKLYVLCYTSPCEKVSNRSIYVCKFVLSIK